MQTKKLWAKLFGFSDGDKVTVTKDLRRHGFKKLTGIVDGVFTNSKGEKGYRIFLREFGFTLGVFTEDELEIAE